MNATFIGIIVTLWLFNVGWLIKMQRDIGKMRQSDINLMNDYIVLRNDLENTVKKSECLLMHKNTADSLDSFKTSVNQRLDRIDKTQDEMSSDIKKLLEKIKR